MGTAGRSHRGLSFPDLPGVPAADTWAEIPATAAEALNLYLEDTPCRDSGRLTKSANSRKCGRNWRKGHAARPAVYCGIRDACSWEPVA